MNARHLAPGSRLGRFVVDSTLGRGALATVYRAEDTASGGTVALKILHDTKAASDDAVERLRREIDLARRVDHPHVCKLFELHQEGNLIFLSMQYIPGRALENIIEDQGKLEPGRAVHILRAVCTGLDAAHQLNILHRDLKPGNIILRPNGEPAILDFGYATGPGVKRVTQTGVWVGTLQYVAPEILKNRPASPSSDIYSLGVTLYRCLTAGYPYDGLTFGEIASAILFREVTPLHHFADLPPRLEQLVLKAIEREPEDRFSDVRAMCAALAPFDDAPFNDAGDTGSAAFANVPEPLANALTAPMATAAARPAAIESATTAPASVTQQTALLATILVAEPLDTQGSLLVPKTPMARDWLVVCYDHLLREIERWDGAPTGAQSQQVVAWFGKADHALRAAMGLQQSLKRLDARFSLRIGIETGLARFDHGNISGDAINAAASLARRAVAAEVLLTPTCHRKLTTAVAKMTTPHSSGFSVAWQSVPAIPKKAATANKPATAKESGNKPATAKKTAERLTTPAEKKPTSKPAAEKRPPDSAKPLPEEPSALEGIRTHLLSELLAMRSELGVIHGDNATLDGLERTAQLELSRGALRDSVRCLQLAREELEEIEIDRSFVAGKMQRLHMAVRERGAQANPQIKVETAQMMAAFAKKDYATVNGVLNRTFAILAG